jgi:tetratricopeptide (TPR) repeat protein
MAVRARAADATLAAKWDAYGQQQYAARQYDAAIQSFSAAARANSGDPVAWRGLGNAFYAKHDYANALKYYKYSLQLTPADSALSQFVSKLTATVAGGGATSALGAAGRFYQAHDYDQAIKQYNTALAENPNSAPAYQGLGNCYYAKGDRAHAVPAYQRALALDPNNAGLKNFLASYAPAEAKQAGVQVAEGPKDWVQPLWRSAVLPGWGQVYNGEPAKGYTVGAVTLGLLAGTVTTYIIGDGARKTYEGLTDLGADYDTPYSTWENMANLNHIFAIGFFTAYTFTLVDTILHAKPATRALGLDPREAPVQWGFLPDGALGVKARLLEF